MSRNMNQSSLDEDIALYLQKGLSELTVNDEVIAREIQQQYQNTLMCDDAAIALEIQQQEGNLQTSLSDDAAIALEIHQQEGTLQPSLSDDEELARYLQQEDESANNRDEDIQETHQYQPMQVNRSYIPQRDDPSSSRSFFHNEVGGNFSGHQIYGPPYIPHYGPPVTLPYIPHYGPPNIPHNTSGENFSGHQIYSPPNVSHNTSPANEDNDSNMTYEGLTELEDSIGAVGRGLSKRRISRLPTHKYGSKPSTLTACTSWFKKKKKFVADDSQCSICLEEYEMGDKITTLPCNHIYHKDCIANWLKRHKECCVCKAEV